MRALLRALVTAVLVLCDKPWFLTMSAGSLYESYFTWLAGEQLEPPPYIFTRNPTSYMQVTWSMLGVWELFYTHGFPRPHIYKSRMGVCTSFTCMALRSFTLPIYHPTTPYVWWSVPLLRAWLYVPLRSLYLPTSHVINVGSLYEGSFTCMALLTNPFLYASYIFPWPCHKSRDQRWESVWGVFYMHGFTHKPIPLRFVYLPMTLPQVTWSTLGVCMRALLHIRYGFMVFASSWFFLYWSDSALRHTYV